MGRARAGGDRGTIAFGMAVRRSPKYPRLLPGCARRLARPATIKQSESGRHMDTTPNTSGANVGFSRRMGTLDRLLAELGRAVQVLDGSVHAGRPNPAGKPDLQAKADLSAKE